jgi:hypothetical protein
VQYLLNLPPFDLTTTTSSGSLITLPTDHPSDLLTSHFHPSFIHSQSILYIAEQSSENPNLIIPFPYLSSFKWQQITLEVHIGPRQLGLALELEFEGKL